MQERDGLEAEISERSARLEAAGVGLDGKLVDKEVLSEALFFKFKPCSRDADSQLLILS